MLADVMKIMFVCLGNICRSAMAEFMMNDALQKRGLSGKYTIDSSATCSFEEGNPTYPKALEKLHEHGVSTYPHYSKPVKKSDYEKYDLFLGMPTVNNTNYGLAPCF